MSTNVTISSSITPMVSLSILKHSRFTKSNINLET